MKDEKAIKLRGYNALNDLTLRLSQSGRNDYVRAIENFCTRVSDEYNSYVDSIGVFGRGMLARWLHDKGAFETFGDQWAWLPHAHYILGGLGLQIGELIRLADQPFLVKISNGRAEIYLLWRFLGRHGQVRWRTEQMDARRLWWDGMTPEQQEAQLAPMRAGYLLWWDALSPEQQEAQLAPMRDGKQLWWDALSPEQQEAHMARRLAGYHLWWDALSPELEEAHLAQLRAAWNKWNKWRRVKGYKPTKGYSIARHCQRLRKTDQEGCPVCGKLSRQMGRLRLAFTLRQRGDDFFWLCASCANANKDTYEYTEACRLNSAALVVNSSTILDRETLPPRRISVEFLSGGEKTTTILVYFDSKHVDANGVQQRWFITAPDVSPTMFLMAKELSGVEMERPVLWIEPRVTNDGDDEEQDSIAVFDAIQRLIDFLGAGESDRKNFAHLLDEKAQEFTSNGFEGRRANQQKNSRRTQDKAADNKTRIYGEGSKVITPEEINVSGELFEKCFFIVNRDGGVWALITIESDEKHQKNISETKVKNIAYKKSIKPSTRPIAGADQLRIAESRSRTIEILKKMFIEK